MDGIYDQIRENIKKVIRGQDNAIRWILAGLISGGHILLEDYPGTGKTTLAKAIAITIDIPFSRVQFTPDLLPSDIVGVSIYNQKDQTFNIHKGPVFTNILLADEINRASPRTQSALLESMAERQVSIDGKIYTLNQLFFVIATQNPIESSGTYPLPEAQMDRFALKFNLGYVSFEDEINIMDDQIDQHPIDSLKSVVSKDQILKLRENARKVALSEEIKKYIVDIVRATREFEGVKLGASPRAALTIMKIAQVLALFDGYKFVTPEHIQEIAIPAIAHRVILEPQFKFSGQTSKTVVEKILYNIKAPS